MQKREKYFAEVLTLRGKGVILSLELALDDREC